MPVVAMHLPIFDHVFPGQLDLVPSGTPPVPRSGFCIG